MPPEQPLPKAPNPTHHTCPICKYTWQHGQHGGHDCTVYLLEQLKIAIIALRNTAHCRMSIEDYQAHAKNALTMIGRED